MNDRIAGPYDVIVAGRGFMADQVADQNGNPTGELAWNQEAMRFSPGSPTPEAEPYTIEQNFEVAQVFSNWRSGAGFRQQTAEADRDVNGWWYARYIDKYGDYMGNAAAVTAVTPAVTDAVNGGNQFIEFTVGGTRKLVCAMGRYVKVRNADTAAGWATAKDLGAGMKITGLAVFRGQQAGDQLFIAYQNSSAVAQTYQVWDGASDTTTFAADTSALAPKAVDFTTWRDELWVLFQDANGRWMQAKTIVGGSATAWGAPYAITDSSNTCRHLLVDNDHLITRSVYGPLDKADEQYYHAKQLAGDMFKSQYAALNECRPIAFLPKGAIFQNGNSWYTYNADTGDFLDVGPGTLKDMDSAPTVGIVTANAAYGQLTVYYAMYNAVSGTAYLWRWGEWEHLVTAFHPIDSLEFLPSHIGALYEQGSQINGMIVTSVPTGTPRLYWVDAAGVVSSMQLPRFSTGTQVDTAVTYNTTNAFELYPPAITYHNPIEDKVNYGIMATLKNASAGVRDVTVSYRLDATSAYGGSANLENSGVFNQDPGQRNNFTASVLSKWLDTKVVGRTTTAATPMLIKDFGAYEGISPVFKWVYSTVLRVGNDVKRRDGETMGRFFRTEDAMAHLVLQASSGVISIVTPDGSTVDVKLTSIGKVRTVYRKAGEQVEYLVPVEFMQHRATTVAGQEQRVATLTEGQAAAYTELQLTAF